MTPMAHRSETWRSVLREGFWFVVCIGLLIAICSVGPSSLGHVAHTWPGPSASPVR